MRESLRMCVREPTSIKAVKGIICDWEKRLLVRNATLCCTFQICQRLKKVIAKNGFLCCRYTVNVWSGPEGKADKTVQTCLNV